MREARSDLRKAYRLLESNTDESADTPDR